MTRLMFWLAPFAFAVAAGCSTSTPASPTRAATSNGGGIEMPLTQSHASEASEGTSTELTAYNDRICELIFPGTPSKTSEFFAIWNLGHAILDEPFDTSRPDLYAILPGTMHQVPGSPELDHDHIVSHAPGDPGYNATWDVWVVVPGPNFDAVSYQPPRSTTAMFALISGGVLSPPVGFAAAGFGRDLVLRAPLVCR
jgi:hypothetical protein